MLIENNTPEMVTASVKAMGWNTVQSITLPAGSTVAEFISEAGFSTASDVYWNGQLVPATAKPQNGDLLTVLAGKVTQG